MVLTAWSTVGAVALGPDLFDHRREFVGALGEQEDDGALIRDGQRGGPADAGGRAGNEHMPPRQVTVAAIAPDLPAQVGVVSGRSGYRCSFAGRVGMNLL